MYCFPLKAITKKTSCFVRNFCISWKEACNLRTETEALKLCIFKKPDKKILPQVLADLLMFSQLVTASAFSKELYSFTPLVSAINNIRNIKCKRSDIDLISQ